jgi:hypothetical protein
MERIQVYRDMPVVDLERPLKKIIHEILQNVVKTFGLAIKVLNSSHFLIYLKILAFNEDNGVQGALQALKQLTARENQMTSALIYRTGRQTAKDTKNTREAMAGVESGFNKLADNLQRRELQIADRIQLQKIGNMLSIQKKMDEQHEKHNRLRSAIVEGTGLWLQDETSFKAWADRTTSFNKILLLSADEGYGKTFLVRSAIHALEQIRSAARKYRSNYGRILLFNPDGAYSTGRHKT